jgi:hypothetical protein
MKAGSPEHCTIGESPMFRCNQKGETPKVIQIVRSQNLSFTTEVHFAEKQNLKQFRKYRNEVKSNMFVKTQVLIAFDNVQRNQGYVGGAVQAKPDKAKYRSSIARKNILLMTKATKVSISQEKCTANKVSSEVELDVLQSCSQLGKISTDWN